MAKKKRLVIKIKIKGCPCNGSHKCKYKEHGVSDEVWNRIEKLLGLRSEESEVPHP